MSQYIIIGGDGREYGPKEETEVREWIQQGRLNALSQIKEVGEDEWVSLGSRPERSPANNELPNCPALARRPQCPADLSDPNLSCTVHFSDIVLLSARRYSGNCVRLTHR